MLNPESFSKLADEYRRETGCGIALFADGKLRLNLCKEYPWARALNRNIEPQRMIQESMRWGEPCIVLDNTGIYLWAVPLVMNQRILGGLLSAFKNNESMEERGLGVSQAAWKLLELACRDNLCNESMMLCNREESHDSARRAEAIQTSKQELVPSPREIYLREELPLLVAIQKGHKDKAREIINRILVGVYNQGQGNLEILKTLVLEMVVLMYRAAVEKGADPRELLGINSSYLRDFHEIHTDLEMSHWLTRWLEAFIGTTLTSTRVTPADHIGVALEYMKNTLGEPISRNEVAGICNMSPGYFSKIFKQRTEHTFSELLTIFRIEQASFLLDSTSLSLTEVALESGFYDQSYFTKVFKKHHGLTPRQYRRNGRKNAARNTLRPGRRAG